MAKVRTKRSRATRAALASPGSSFIGRAALMASIDARLAGHARLITLVGPPGTGKTRLALRCAQAVREREPARRHVLVDLTVAGDATELVACVARALGVSLGLARDLEAQKIQVGRALARKPTLLLLDNFEQLAASAPIVASWIENVDTLVVLATSRERLRLRSEEPIEVPPLELPTAAASAADVLVTESVTLLAARAIGYTPVPGDASSLAAIVHALDGLPLAIELAASRLPLLGAAALERMLLGDRATLDALGPAPREVTTRQATLRGAIAWSWSILDDAEQRALAWLSIFRGTFSIEAALAILGGDETLALALVEALREKSLVARDEGTTRARLLVAVQAFAAEKLAERSDGAELRARVARHFATQAARQRRARSGRHARAAHAWLGLEVGALEGALAAAESLPLDRERATQRAELTLALHDVARRIGPAGHDAAALDRSAALLAHLEPDLRVELVVARANALRDRGDTSAATEVLETEAAASGASIVLSALGQTLLASGRFDAAESALERALSAAHGDRPSALAAHAGLGLVAHGRGALDRAEQHYAAALDLAIALGEPASEAAARRDLGNLSLQRGALDRARAHYEEALAKRPGDDLRLEGVVRGNLGIIHQERGELDLALAELRRARECLRQVGDRPFAAHLSGYLGAVMHERGQPDAAREAYGEAIEILREVGDVRLEGVFLAARAVVLAERGLFGHADNDLALAGRRLTEVGDPALTAALELHRASVELARAARDRGDVSAVAARARERIAREEPAIGRSDDARFALRILRRALPADSLEVSVLASWFRVPGRDPVSLASRPTLARVLEALAEARLGRPGVALTWEELLAAGWPDEKVMPGAAQNRVRVALSTLRTLGLRSLLVTDGGGHRLDERVPLRRV